MLEMDDECKIAKNLLLIKEKGKRYMAHWISNQIKSKTHLYSAIRCKRIRGAYGGDD